jgi:hypothetical protein
MNNSDLTGNYVKYFNQVTDWSSQICSEVCGMRKYEKLICNIDNHNRELNYNYALECFQKCLKKNMESSVIGLKKLLEVTKF